MPPRRGQKRKAPGGNGSSTTNGDAELKPPDRDTWTGWVEMESEPAFFNAMLKDMGVRGAKVQELYSIDDEMLAVLPQPVHALIFLFRYHVNDEADQETGINQNDVWFANQIPSFACGTVALLNIVNNIPGLDMGPELSKFKADTTDMDPYCRGDAIDQFRFIKGLHNSFARENDLLQADVHMLGKFNQAKKRLAVAKGVATKAANKAAKEAPLNDTTAQLSNDTRSSLRSKDVKMTNTGSCSSKASTPASQGVMSGRPTPEPGEMDDGSFQPGKGKKCIAVDSARPATVPRRSARAPKPRNFKVYESEAEEAPEEGFHFIAYMPVNGHVWKLDGLDYFPHDMGAYGKHCNGADGGTGNWMHAAAPAIQSRMLQYEEGGFNLMAVVHNPDADDRKALAENVKTIQVIDTKLDKIYDDWRALDGAETKRDTVVGISEEFDITQSDIDRTPLPKQAEQDIAAAQDDFMKFIPYRQTVIARQSQLRGVVRDTKVRESEEEEKTRHRRHDYGSFVRKWMSALAELGALEELAET